MNKPRIKPTTRKEAEKAKRSTPNDLNITNAAKLPQEVKDSLLVAKGAIQQMIDQYVDDTLLYLRSGSGDAKAIIQRGESLKRLLKGLNKPSASIDPEVRNYPYNKPIKR